MKRVLLVTPYNLTRKEVGGAFTYQFCERLSESCKIDVILYQYEGDVLDNPNPENVDVISAKKIGNLDKLLSWLQCPCYHPLFTSRYSIRMINFINRNIKEKGYDFVVFDYSQTFAMAKAIKHPHKLLIAHDVIYQRFEREGSKLINWIKWSEGKLVKGSEKLYAFSDKDCKLIEKLYGEPCDCTPVFIKKHILATKPTKCENYHVFFADWGRKDNSESLEWFLDNVAHHIKETQFKVIGGGLSQNLKNKLGAYSNFEYLGFVDNPYPMIANAKSEISPLHKGAGIKVKCLEALACGTPVIGTEIAFEGIDTSFRKYLLLADEPKQYINLISDSNFSVQEKQQIKEEFIKGYGQKSIVNYIII